MDGVDDLGAIDPLQVDRCNAKVGVPELALDHDQGHALVSQLTPSITATKLSKQP